MLLKYRLSLILLPFFCLACNSKQEKPTAKNTDNTIGNTPVTTPGTAPNPYAEVDISPMDMSYFPVDYPKLRMAKKVSTAPLARVIYSRPHLQGRHLFHTILKYGEPWRLGANESTELDLYSDATIQNKKIKAGRYVLYCIPQADKWTIVLNSNIDSWGLEPDATRDIEKFEIPVKQTTNHLEFMTIIFEKADNGANLLMAWDDLEARLPIRF